MGHSPPGSSVRGILRQKYWSGLPCPPPADLPDPGIKPMPHLSPELAGEFFTTSATWEAGLKYVTLPSHICTAYSPWEAAPRDLHGSISALLQVSSLISPFRFLLDRLIKTSILSPLLPSLSPAFFSFFFGHTMQLERSQFPD